MARFVPENVDLNSVARDRNGPSSFLPKNCRKRLKPDALIFLDWTTRLRCLKNFAFGGVKSR